MFKFGNCYVDVYVTIKIPRNVDYRERESNSKLMYIEVSFTDNGL